MAKIISPAVGRISSPYGPRNYAPSPFHAGMDVANDIGTPVRAAYAGTVVDINPPYRSGPPLVIKNPDGEAQYYGHMHKHYVSVGDHVRAGQVIGEMGARGQVTGPHLHFECWAVWNDPSSHRDPQIDFDHFGVEPGSRAVIPGGAPSGGRPSGDGDTGYYLLDHKNATQQYRETRRNDAEAVGQLTLHSAENDADLTGVDKGAESVANFITGRDDYGSYHDLTDRDSHVPMAPNDYETWHSIPTNNWSNGLAMALSVADLDEMTKAQREAYFKGLSGVIVEKVAWFRDKGVKVPTRRFLTRAEAMDRKPGLTTHSRTDPDRRTDPFGPPGKDKTERYEEEFLDILAEVIKAGGYDFPQSKAPTEPEPKRRGGPSSLSKANVENIQRALSRNGYYDGRIDGDYGPMTHEAVEAYQRAQNRWASAGLYVDGDWGPVVQDWFEWVEKLQRALPAWKGVPDLRVDGDYGNVTARAVRTLQSRNDLYVDGIAGSKTVAFMRSHGSNVPHRP